MLASASVARFALYAPATVAVIVVSRGIPWSGISQVARSMALDGLTPIGSWNVG